MKIPYKDMINRAYKAYNAKNMEAMLVLMHEKIEWPNGWKGGILKGKQQVNDYWTEQWKHIDVTVTPIAFRSRGDGRVRVIVHQLVKDKKGRTTSDEVISHVYSFEDDLVKSMEIEPG